MKILLVNGSPHEKGCTYTALCEVASELEKHNIESEILWLGRAPISSCMACGGCSVKHRCVHDDCVNRAIDIMSQCDGIIVGSPVHYAGPSGQITSFLGRLFYSGSQVLSGKPAAAVVSCRRGGASSAYESLCKFFQMSNMPVVTSQYWNSVHGSNPDEVKRDLEGLQTMRTLAVNFAWILENIAAGRRQSVAPPHYEPKQRTNFIR